MFKESHSIQYSTPSTKVSNVFKTSCHVPNPSALCPFPLKLCAITSDFFLPVNSLPHHRFRCRARLSRHHIKSTNRVTPSLYLMALAHSATTQVRMVAIPTSRTPPVIPIKFEGRSKTSFAMTFGHLGRRYAGHAGLALWDR